MTRGLCFDIDGTLIDSSRSGLTRILQLARKRNLPITPEIEQGLRSIWGASPLKLIEKFWPQENPHTFFTEWENLDIAEPHLSFPGTKEALEKLSKHFKMVIVTNRAFRTIRSQLEFNGIAEFFELIITPGYNGYKKPEPQIMEPILARFKMWDISKNNTFLIGDTIEGDWKLAQAIGMEFFAVTSGGIDTRERFLAAGVAEDHIIDSVAKLPQILLK